MIRLLACCVGLSSTTLWASEASDYKHGAKALVKTIRGGDAQAINEQARKLVDLSVPLVEQFLAKNPSCKDYLEKTLENRNSMMDLPVEQIEKDFHAGQALPSTKNPDCYNAKDLIVHPATVAAMAKQETTVESEQRKSMSREITEVLGHLKKVTDKI